MTYLLCLNWNTTDMLIRMYESAIGLACNDFNFVIVDNGSTQEEYNKLVNYNFKNCVIIRNEKNLGFAAGNNVGLKAISEEKCSIIFINSDIIIKEKDWDFKFHCLLSQDEIGVVGCAYHPLRWSSNGTFNILPLSDKPVESEGVQGAFFGIRKEVLDKVGYFDEDFKYAQYEEMDLQFRIIKTGLKCFWIPCEHIHDHHKSATKKHGYKLNDEIQNEQQFKVNAQKNKQLLLTKHADWFSNKN